MSVERTLIRSFLIPMAALAIGSIAVAAPIEDEEIGTAMRRFRIQAFQAFRSNRHEYDRRVRYVQGVLKTWSRLGSPQSERASLIDFLNQAARASQHGREMPKFEFSKAATEKNVRRRTDPSSNSRTDQRRRRRSADPIVAPDLPLLPRQEDREWATPRVRKADEQSAIPLTLRLESRVPRATPYRLAESPAPASRVKKHEIRNGGNKPELAPKADPGPVDLTLLAARIRASNLKLSEVESELMEQGQWDSRRLEPLVHQFDAILSGRRLSRLYYEALSDFERKQLFTAISPPQPVLSLLSQRWFEARVASTDATDDEWPNNEVESNRLESIARTIDLWKSEYPGYRN